MRPRPSSRTSPRTRPPRPGTQTDPERPTGPAEVDPGPRRTCVGCRRVAPAARLVRLRVDRGRLVLGPGPGRGAWVCPGVECLDLAVGRRGLARALRQPTQPGGVDEVRSALSLSGVTDVVSTPGESVRG